MNGTVRRIMKGGYVRAQDLRKGPNGRSLCRWCGIEVPKGRRTFCSDWCVSEWRLRTDPGYLREQVFERDKGVCAHCGLDTTAEWARIRRSRNAKQRGALAEWGLRGMTRSSLWDADHILPVSEGGGECDLSNIRTLCIKCHRNATAELRLRSTERRRHRPTAPGTGDSRQDASNDRW
jgi:5-methylcytosine-specific restriction enzyme A